MGRGLVERGLNADSAVRTYGPLSEEQTWRRQSWFKTFKTFKPFKTF